MRPGRGPRSWRRRWPPTAPCCCPAPPTVVTWRPLLALELHRPFVAWAHRVGTTTATVTDHAGRVEHDVDVDGPCVVTLRPGSRAVDTATGAPPPVEQLEPGATPGDADVTHVEDLPPDPTTMDLAEAPPHRRRRCRPRRPGAVRHAGATRGRLGRVARRHPGGHRRRLGAAPTARSARPAWRWRPSCTWRSASPGPSSTSCGLGDPAHVVAVNLDPSCPMMAMADLAIVTDGPAVVRAPRRPARTGAGRRAMPRRPRSGGERRLRRRRRGGGTGRVGRGARCGAGRPADVPARAGPLPRLEEHVRRRRLRADPRRPPAPLVGAGAGAAVGGAAQHDDHRPRGAACPSTCGPTGGARRPTTAPPPCDRRSTAGSPTRPSPPGRPCCAPPPSPGCSATATGPSPACVTDRHGEEIGAVGRHRLRRRQLVPRQGGGAAPPRRRRALHARRQGGAGAAQRGDRRAASASSDRDGVDIEIVGVHRGRGRAAASSTPTSTRSPSASSCTCPASPPRGCVPRRSSPG